MKKCKILVGMCVVAFLFGCAHQQSPAEDIVEQLEVIDDVLKSLTPEEAKKSSFGDYSYTGIFDPSEIVDNWEQVVYIPVGPSMVEYCYGNPDFDSPCTRAIIFVIRGRMEGYSYLCDGKVDVFVFNSESGIYESNYDESDLKRVQLWKDKYKTYFEFSES